MSVGLAGQGVAFTGDFGWLWLGVAVHVWLGVAVDAWGWLAVMRGGWLAVRGGVAVLRDDVDRRRVDQWACRNGGRLNVTIERAGACGLGMPAMGRLR